MTTIGSLFSGYRGLDAAVESVTGGHTVWHGDIDPGACKILAHHWPGVPNLGDISAVDWDSVEPVDIITGGFPCQDVSMAGRRAGLTAGTRSGLWAMMADAINHLHPSLVVIENVRGLLSAAADSDVEPCPWCVGDPGGEPPLRALGAVLGDLADIGYDAAWHGLTAASVGAPHGRFRVFIVAWPAADTGREYGQRWADEIPRSDSPARSSGRPRQPSPLATDTDEIGRDGWAGELGSGRWREPADRSQSYAQSPERAESADLGASVGSAAEPGERVGTDQSTGPERMMGYWDHADSSEGRPDQVLRDVRGTVHAQAVQRQTRGSDAVPGASELLAVVREYTGGSSEGHASLASTEAPAADLSRVQDSRRSARPPSRPQPREQRPNEPPNPLLVLPPQDALVRGPAEAYGRCGEGRGYGCSAWGQFAQAIHRWEICLGRIAPSPTELSAKGSHRLSPRAVEFMMGLPDGHVTGIPGLTRNEQLKALGNGVVPQQAEAALRVLLNAMEAAA